MNSLLNRRQFLGVSLAGLGTLYLRPMDWAWGAEPPATDHFFLKICIPGGVDNSYFFDARPLEMTAASLMQNYLKEDPELYTGVNGTTCYATSIAKAFAPYRERFSVLNGVIMTPSFDGHDQNSNVLFAGDPFGGGSYLTHLNQLSPDAKMPIDTYQSGSTFVSLDNLSKTITLAPKSFGNLIEKLKGTRSRATADPSGRGAKLLAFLQEQLHRNADGDGRFSTGSGQMLTGFAEAPALAAKLTQIQLDPKEEDPVAQFVRLLAGLFHNGVVRSALWIPATPDMMNFDAHAPKDAATQPELMKKLTEQLTKLFKLMGETPFDSTRSLWDVTTFMMASEFGRTMRQDKHKIDETGTDHNPLNNSVWVGGKGIKGGQIIGASDRRTSTDAISKAHGVFDPMNLKIMGKPFDFTTAQPRTDLPETYNANDYLTIASVVNTIYSLFSVPEANYRLTQRNGDRAKTIPSLLV